MAKQVTETMRASATGIQVIARAAEILRAVQAAPGGLSQSEIADQLDLARSTVHRILNALEEEGFVAVHATRGRYRLGPEIPRMADAARRGLVDQLHPHLVDLSREVNETVDLSILDQGRVTFIDQIVAPHRLRAVSAVGESFPLHCTAPGKAILADLAPQRLAAVLPASLPRLTQHTITSIPELMKDLKRVVAEGVAYDREEHHEGISAVGCTIPDLSAAPLAVSVPLPTQRFEGREAELAEAVLDCRSRIRAAIGNGARAVWNDRQ